MKKQFATNISASTNPTITDNIAAGYSLGQEWFNIASGEKFYHKFDGVWVPRSKSLQDVIDVNKVADRVEFKHVPFNGSAFTGGYDYLIDFIESNQDAGVYIYGDFAQYGTSTGQDIVKVNSDGTVDTSFNVGTGFNNYPYTGSGKLAQTAAGKLYVSGSFTTYNGTTVNRIVRLNTNGTIDSSFVTGSGFYGGLDYTNSIGLDSSENVYVAGGCYNYNGTSIPVFARLLSNGTLDTSFVMGSGFDNTTTAILVNSDDTLFVGGHFTTYNGTSSPRFVKLLSNGGIDTSFVIGAGFNGIVTEIVKTLDNKIIVVGSFTTYKGVSANKIIKLNLDGSRDVSFDMGTGFSGSVYLTKTLLDGKVSLIADPGTYNGTSITSLVILNTDGSIFLNPTHSYTGFSPLSDGRYIGMSNTGATDNYLVQVVNGLPIQDQKLTFSEVTGKAEYTIDTLDGTTTYELLPKHLIESLITESTVLVDSIPTDGSTNAVSSNGVFDALVLKLDDPSGIASQYIRGDGTLASFPDIAGGGGGQVYYLNGGISQGVIGSASYYQMSVAANVSTGVDFTSGTSSEVFANFITDTGKPTQETIPAGVWILQCYFSQSESTGTPEVSASVEVYNGATFSVLSSSLVEQITNGTAIDLYTFTVTVPEYTPLTPSDRIAIRFSVGNLSGTNTISLHTQGPHFSSVQTTFTTGLASLDGLTSAAQYFQTGTTGSDFNIATSGNDTHVFNLPTASATKRGALSSSDWTLFNGKAPLDSPIFTTQITSPIVNISAQTATTIASFDASKNVVSLSTATYPSLSELAYVKGVTSNIQTQLNSKATFSGTANYLIKYGTSTTQATSRIQDTGTYIGISTINPPAKDLTFVGTKTIEIGLEDYSPILEGKDLNIAAGRAVNFAYGTFSKLNFGNGGTNGYGGIHISPTTNVAYIVQRYSSLQTSTYPYTTMTDTGIGMSSAESIYMTPQNNLYLTDYGSISKRTNNTGAFVSQATFGSLYAKGITSTSNGDLYYCVTGGDIYKQTNQTGTPVALGQTTRFWSGLAADSSDNIYACVDGGDIYKRVGTGNFIAMGYTTRAYTCITITPIGDVYLGDTSGNVWKQTLGAGAPALFAAVGLGIKGITCDSYSNLYITIGSAVTGADVYFNLNSTTGTADLQGGTLKLNAGTGKGTGDSNLDFYTGQKTTSGTDMQTATLRTRINNEGLMTLPSVTNTLINADSTGKAVVTKEWVSSLTATKQSLFTGTVNYLPKSLTSTTLGVSRIQDDGSFLGIGSVSPIALTKDIQLGRQANKEFGVEQSNSLTIGRDLIVSAGRTINYDESSLFLALNQATSDWRGISSDSSGNIYTVQLGVWVVYKQTGGTGNFAAHSGSGLDGWVQSVCVAPNGNTYVVCGGNTPPRNGTIFIQTGGVGNFTDTLQTQRQYMDVASTATNNIYTVVYGGDIYMQTAGTGSFNALSQTSRAWTSVACASNGDVYATVDGGDIYKQTGGTGTFTALGQTSRAWYGITVAPNGNVYAVVNSGDIYLQTGGIGTFTALGQTSRLWSDICAAPNGNIYATVLGTGDIYMQTNSGVGTADLQGGTLKLKAGTGKGVGQSRIQLITGSKTISGTDMQLETIGAQLDETGLMTLPSVTNTLINADSTGKAVVTKEWVDVNSIIIATSSNITTSTANLNGYGQHGRNTIIDNGSTPINLTCLTASNSFFVSSYTKLGSAPISFVAGSGVTLVQVDGTLILNGITGSTACLTRNSNTYYLQISNR